MRYSTQIFLLFLSLSVLTFSQDTEAEAPTEAPIENPGADSFHACNPIDRPEVCTEEYRPVCGYVQDCEGGACTSTYGNNCLACAQENVAGYVEGACEEVREVCDPDNRPEVCTLIYTATCAVAADCQGPHCFEDTDSPCVACGMQNVAYSLPGTCPSNNRAERTYCDPNRRPEACTLEWNPVCAHRANCVGDTCYYTAGNPCGACTNTDVGYHTPGECSDDELGEGEGEGEGESEGELNLFGGEDRTYCDPDNRPEICTADYTPVCAHRADCDGDDCFYTAGNACGACGDPDVDWHVPGECPNDDTDNGEDDTDDERTYCDADNRPGACTKEYNPVCAHKAGCEGDGCEYTAGNACMACSDVSVDYHTPGEC